MRPIARKEELVIQELAGEVLIYDLRTNKAICLNQTSALVWQNCDGKKTALEIAAEMEKHLALPVNEDVVWFALNQLEKENLLAANGKIPNRFSDLSRREIIKRIGAASVVALPVIASIVAPSSVMAQTSCIPGGGGGPGCPCTGNGTCSSGSCNMTTNTCT